MACDRTVSHEGLVRCCCTPYEEPTNRNSHKLTGHLTNYAINKYEAAYEHDDDPTDGSRGTKRSLSAVMEYLKELGHDTEELWNSTVALVGETAIAMASTLLDEEPAVPQGTLWPPPEGWGGYEMDRKKDMMKGVPELGPGELNKGGFHVLGFDVMYCREHKKKSRKNKKTAGEVSARRCPHHNWITGMDE